MPPSDQVPHQQVVEQSAANPSPLSPHFSAAHVPSPPPPSSGVRRHQSLTYGAQRQMPSSGLKRAGTLQQTGSRHATTVGQSPSPPDPEEEEYSEEKDLVNPYDDESYFTPRSPPPNQQQYGSQGPTQYPTSPAGRASPWGTPTGADWRTPGGGFSGSGMTSVDDVARALSAMEFNNPNQLYSNNTPFQAGQSVHPPRFNPTQPPPLSPGSMRQNAMQAGNGASRKLQLNTHLEGRRTPTGQSVRLSIPRLPSPDVICYDHHSADLRATALQLVPLHGTRGRSASPSAPPTQVWIMAITKVKRAASLVSHPYLHNISTRWARCRRLG